MAINAEALRQIGGYYFPFLVFGILNALSLPLCYVLLPKFSSIFTQDRPGKEGQVDGMPVENPVPIRPWHLLKIPKTMLIACIIPLTSVYWSFLGPNLEQHLSPVRSKFLIDLLPFAKRQLI